MDIKTVFTENEKSAINEAVTEAEKKTSAEIVPLITDASGRYDRGEDLFGVVLGGLTVALVWWVCQGTSEGTGWAASLGPSIDYGLPGVLATFLSAFVAGAALASRYWPLRHLFTAKKEMEACLRSGAERAFHVHALGRSTSRMGVLIYVSLFERMVYVLGDASVAEKLSDADFQEVKDAIVRGFRQGNAAEGLQQAIALLGEKLARDFPAGKHRENEIPNQLILYEQNL